MKKLALIISLLLGWQTAQAQLVINEFMQSNVDCIMDDLKDFPDSWVELYNSGEDILTLQDYKLGITDDPSEAWQLPDVKVPSKEWVLVYCDKVGRGLHTSFRLDSGKGGAVYLFQGDKVIDQVKDIAKQPAPNSAYGRKTDGSKEWGYQLEPSPNAANTGKICDHDHILGEPVFSEQGRVVKGTQALTLSLSLPKDSPEGTEIYYTTNGTEPTLSSKKYTSEISIDKSTAIRAKLFCDGWLSPVSTVQSYIFHDRRLTIPIISLVTDNRYLNDSKIGIFVNNKTHEKSRQVDWRRPINFELFDSEGKPSQLNQLCETRITGAYSREASRQSMAIYCHKRFGHKNLEYEFFPDQCPGLTNYKSIVLRNAGNDRDGIYMRDAVAQRAMAKHADIDWQAWRPAVIYINGNYWGILNIRERANANNIITHYDGLEDIDLIENGELKEGTIDNYNAFVKFYSEQTHTLAEYAEIMDWEEYIRITAMNFYFNNLDYPGNNNVLWRPRAEGGKWRWIAKDLDYTMGLYNGNAGESGGYDHRIIAQWYNPDDWNLHQGANFSSTKESTTQFRRMREDADFSREFIDRF
ncbi:MAG: CotH kinase family protein, partial [Prevotella sp.]|nr:CotH kinase family protein [Prevotella sp.]